MFFLHPVNVWIIGDSYVRRGAERAAETMGDNLGHDNLLVQWFGWGGLRWKSLVPFFRRSLQGRAVPDVLLIHCGGNDLGSVKSVGLVAAMKEDLRRLHLQYPDMTILFSELTQRCRWRAGDKPAKLDKARRFVNSVMATFVPCLNGVFVHHPHIRFDTPGLFVRDGVHLTPRGNDIFLNSFAESIKAQLQQQ